MTIPSKAALIKNKGRIPNSVAQLPSLEDPESEPFKLSFRHYKDKLCEINSLLKNAPKRLLMDLKKVGQLNNISQFQQKGISIIGVTNAGAYKVLFNKLPPDIEMKEHKIQGEQRLFYFIIKDIVHIVCIKSSHFDTDKKRK